MAFCFTDNPELYFQVKLFAGNGTAASSTQSITFDGSENMKPDLVWFKKRSGADDHELFDSVRSVQNALDSNSDNAEASGRGLTAFNSNGFTVGNGSSAGNQGATNENGHNFVTWNWKCGTSVSGTTTGGTGKAYSGSVSADAGISIITYLGNDNSAHVIPHHLGIAPELTIIKERTNSDIWVVQNVFSGFGNYMTLHTTAASASNGGNFITSVSSSAVTMNENAVNNANNESYILYSFVSKKGYSKVGTFRGNGNENGATIFCGFEPAYILLKQTNSTRDWFVYDNKRDTHNVRREQLEVNSTAAADSYDNIDFTATGFKLRTTSVGRNGDGNTYLFYAVGKSPLVNSSGVPNTAR